MTEPAVRFDRITKQFPGVPALVDVSIDIAAGSCHALCGENGAGKSTLGKLLAGIHAADSGRMFVHGHERRFSGPREALVSGVAMVHQEPAFCDNLSVAENLCLASLPATRGFVRRGEMRDRAERMLAEIGASIDVTRQLGELSVGQRQMVQIATAVSGGARIIVFDEPTSSLTQVEADRLYELLQRLKARGVTCLFVSHRMPEIFRLCDTVSVLRDGRHVATRAASSLTENELVELMIGRTITPLAARARSATSASDGSGALSSAMPSDVLLDVHELSLTGQFERVSFAVRAGEIVGLAGLVGAGRSQVAESIFGVHPASTGRIRVRGRDVHIDSPRAAIRLGIGLVPEDRKRQGIVPHGTCRENMTLATLRDVSRLGLLRLKDERTLAEHFIRRLRIRTPSGDAPVSGLSGGNQQKIVLARWLAARSQLLILDEPTRGVDVGGKAEIHALITDLAARGVGILLISSELPEVLALSDRILVLREGRVAGEAGGGATERELLRLMAGVGAVAAEVV
ncbi:MAG: sugar ABC transporter ATP-binding protein [Gemmatimonas sp.]